MLFFLQKNNKPILKSYNKDILLYIREKLFNKIKKYIFDLTVQATISY